MTDPTEYELPPPADDPDQTQDDLGQSPPDPDEAQADPDQTQDDFGDPNQTQDDFGDPNQTQQELYATQDVIPATRENLGDDEQGGLFGRVAVSMGYCTEADIAAALDTMVAATNSGQHLRLGEVLVDTGALTPAQVANVLHQQARVLLRCTNCGHQFNADVKDDATLPACPKCGGALEVPSDITHVGVEATIDPDPLRTMDEGVELDEPGGDGYNKLEGTTLGPYRIEKKLGEGGMGAVFSAEHEVMHQPVALKVLPADLSSEKDRVRRFLREAESMAKVRHPNIVQVMNVGSDRDLYYIAMEKVEGGDLGDLISDDELQEIPEAIRLVVETAKGLAAAHAQGLIHRDIKPDNVLLTPDKTPKVADFGLAKAVEAADGATALTGANAIMGTPAYMSPEQVNGDPADARSDIYSLGVMFFELLTGERPFNANQPMAVMMMHLREDAPPPIKLRPEIPQSISNVVERMLAKEPAERYENAGEFVETMEAIARGEEIAYTARRIRRRRMRFLMTVLILLALGAGGGLIFTQLSGKGIETHAQRVKRLDEEAHRAYESREDDAARAAVEALLREDPQNARARALQTRLEIMATAEGAWATNDAAATIAALAPAVKSGDDDRRLNRLHEAAAAYQAALAAMQQRNLEAARKAASTVIATLKEHPPSQRILVRARHLQVAVDSKNERAWTKVVPACDAALAVDASDPWAAQLRSEAGAALLAPLQSALDAKALDQAELAAVPLRESRYDAAPAQAALKQVQEARRDYDSRFAAGMKHLTAGDGTAALEQFEIAQAIWPSADVRDRILEARVRAHRTAASEAAARGDLVAAIAAMEEARKLAPAESAVLAELAEYQAQRARGNADAASRLTVEARRALDNNALDRADRLIRDAEQLVSDHPVAAELRAELSARRSVPEGFVYLPGGTYNVGQAGEPHNNPHTVELAPVYIAIHEVTNAEFAEFLAAGGYGEGPWWPAGTTEEWRAGLKDATGRPGPATWQDGAYPAGQERHPVTGISWAEAQAYARWRNGRLPTEWEWEAAAAGGQRAALRYPWGDAWEPARVGLGPGRDPAIGPVGSNPGDRSPLGCLDMAGSAKEWTGSAWAEGDDNRVLRGGCTHPVAVSLAEPSRSCSAAHRLARANGHTVRIPGVGFRIVKEVRP